jgi:hypothetical protein
MVAFRFDVGVQHLVVEKLRGLGPAGNAPVVIVQQASKERKLFLLIQNLNLHEVGELASECLDVLIEPSNIVLDMGAQQRLSCCRWRTALVVRQQRQPDRARGERAPFSRHLRPVALKQNAIEDFNLIKMVALCCKELPPLVDSCFHNRIVIRRERYVGALRFEEVLVDMEA